MNVGGGADEISLSGQRVAEVLAAAVHVVVVGDVVLDEWISGGCDRLCREGPAPVLDVTSRTVAAGAAANTAANLAALGAGTSIVTAVGADGAGERLLAVLGQHGVDCRHVLRLPTATTPTKSRVLSDGRLLVRIDEGAPQRAVPEVELLERLRAAVTGQRCDAVLVCDYGLSVVSPALRAEIARLRPRIGLLAVDAHDLRPWSSACPDVVLPNAAEAAALLGVRAAQEDSGRAAQFDQRRRELLDVTGATTAVVTLDRDGAIVLSGDEPIHQTWARPAPNEHAAGAGDTFAAASTIAAAAGLSWPAAAEIGQLAADVVTHRPGTAVCTQAELLQRLSGQDERVVGIDELVETVAQHRRLGHRIVFTNGCFDVLHRGHVAYLNEAKSIGDVLIVAVNDDASVRALKGADRPVNPVADRAAVLAAISCIDYVTVFGGDTPADVIRALQPDIYVKGGDYRPEMLSETAIVRSYGGQVRMLSYVPDRSTSTLIKRIRSQREPAVAARNVGTDPAGYGTG
ncbi:D-glycero-beta-D-manno-heptose 1-phosphate adenylyltransferase [Skermania sp. ID1734]|nr:D-glycero-beta-D-manno-heptose 1-phosphate adenylyltransferase [Skermania sp. ID1734]